MADGCWLKYGRRINRNWNSVPWTSFLTWITIYLKHSYWYFLWAPKNLLEIAYCIQSFPTGMFSKTFLILVLSSLCLGDWVKIWVEASIDGFHLLLFWSYTPPNISCSHIQNNCYLFSLSRQDSYFSHNATDSILRSLSPIDFSLSLSLSFCTPRTPLIFLSPTPSFLPHMLLLSSCIFRYQH